jgi:hypothetical protein
MPVSEEWSRYFFDTTNWNECTGGLHHSKRTNWI